MELPKGKSLTEKQIRLAHEISIESVLISRIQKSFGKVDQEAKRAITSNRPEQWAFLFNNANQLIDQLTSIIAVQKQQNLFGEYFHELVKMFINLRFGHHKIGFLDGTFSDKLKTVFIYEAKSSHIACNQNMENGIWHSVREHRKKLIKAGNKRVIGVLFYDYGLEVSRIEATDRYVLYGKDAFAFLTGRPNLYSLRSEIECEHKMLQEHLRLYNFRLNEALYRIWEEQGLIKENRIDGKLWLKFFRKGCDERDIIG